MKSDDWRSQYDELIIGRDIKASMEVKNDNIPEFLYKFREFDDKNHWKDWVHGKIYVGTPSGFNDPFDCTYCFTSDSTNTLIDRYYPEELKKQRIHPLRLDANFLKPRLKVACFAENLLSTVMWSHYSAKHSGFCLSYNFLRNEWFKQFLCPVVYCEKRYKLSDVEAEDWSIPPMLMKAKAWNYEREWRFIHAGDKDEEIILDCADSLVAIYLGVNISSPNRDALMKEVSDLNIRIPVYEISMSDDDYALVK